MSDTSLAISLGQCSRAGRKAVSQDFHGVVIPPEPQLSSRGIALAIADGISSSEVSQVASEVAVTGFLEDYYCCTDAWSVKRSVHKVLAACNAWLYAQTQSGPYRFNRDRGYICTFSALILKANSAFVFHCGDSRIYRLVGQSLEPLTQDHRHVLAEDASYLTRALGMHPYVELDYQALAVERGDIFILATDGVYEYLSTAAIAQAIGDNEEDLDAAAEHLLNEAYHAGSPDNLTIQIVRVDSLPARGHDEIRQCLGHLRPPPLLSARDTFEGYDILRELYISSRSHVFLARDRDNGQLLALKTPSTELRDSRDYLESLMMEDWIGRRIDNANVLRAIAPHSPQRFIYATTEFVEGQTLAQWIIDNPAPSIDRVRVIVEQIAKGLRAFHRQEMVHQDIRPQNILIDSHGTVKIIDFGSTKVAGISEAYRRNHGVVGTAQYTAPEYFLGEEGTARSDLFALGVISYQMLTGELPYGNGVSSATSKTAQARLRYRPLTALRDDLPGWVDFALHRALHISPEKRYRDVAEFVYDLRTPNTAYLRQCTPPLIERKPVLVWQCVAFGLLALLLLGQALP